MEELTYEQYIAIQDFAEGLKRSFEDKRKNGDKIDKILMNFAIDIVNLHLELAKIKFNKYATNMAKYYGEK